MRIAIVVLLCAANAYAQPVSYQTKLDVPLGQKPQVRITAAQPVTDVRIELDRDDGKHVVVKQGALARNQAVTLSIGDGAAGKASWKGTISAQAAGADHRWSDPLQLDTFVRPPLHVGYDAEHLDLDKHELRFTMSRPAGQAEITAIGEDGSELGKGSATYAKDKPSTWVAITWTQPATSRVLMLKLHAESADGGEADVQLVPWSVSIDHEDVNFATDSAEIATSEDGKLGSSVTKIQDIVKRSEKFVKMKLYVAGHTDTVGPSAKNQKLSLARAQAIAAYFRKQGIALPIAVAGFGEDVLKVPTKDETDERANRRADYVIGPVGAPPPFKGPYQKARATWVDIR
jgi:outer membrane protein OmpA-like peptidoglycan-associated protein